MEEGSGEDREFGGKARSAVMRWVQEGKEEKRGGCGGGCEHRCCKKGGSEIPRERATRRRKGSRRALARRTR